jgi:hypothetical protein
MDGLNAKMTHYQKNILRREADKSLDLTSVSLSNGSSKYKNRVQPVLLPNRNPQQLELQTTAQ